MSGIQGAVEDIINELARIQRLTPADIMKAEDVPIPRLIATGDGGSLVVNEKIDTLISGVSQALKDADPSLANKAKDEEWRQWVRKAFGPPLATLNPGDPVAVSATSVLSCVRSALRCEIDALAKCEHGFGCALFGNGDIATFDIGPVRFEPRISWLDRKLREGDLSAVMHRRVKNRWEGKKVAKRKNWIESLRESDILQAIGACPYVCSVKTDGLAAQVRLEKSLTAARLALTSIALLWEEPSQVLDGFRLLFDRDVRSQKALTFMPGKIILAGSRLSGRPHGPIIEPSSWQSDLALKQVHFAACGEVLEYVLSPDGKVSRAAMMNTLAQAVLWFHEGCSDSVTLMAIVKFSASMDSLGGGKKASGILDVMQARLGLPRSAAIGPNGTTLKSMIDKVYSDARSRTIHGTNDKLGHDWSITRGIAEYFARYCLVSCLDWAGLNGSINDPAALKK